MEGGRREKENRKSPSGQHICVGSRSIRFPASVQLSVVASVAGGSKKEKITREAANSTTREQKAEREKEKKDLAARRVSGFKVSGFRGNHVWGGGHVSKEEKETR